MRQALLSPISRPEIDWRQQAQQYVSQLTQTLLERLRKALVGAYGNGPRGVQDAIRRAFTAGGYLDGTPRPWLLATVAERFVNQAYQAGFVAGLNRPEVRAELTGFQYVATLDDRTTDICTAYHGVKLPAGHPWLQTHWPQNHWGCRSVCVPLFGDFTATPESDLPYTPPPQPGFGAAPLYVGWPVVAPTPVPLVAA